VTLIFSWQRALLLFGTAVALAACSTGPQITRTQDLSESADAPYQKILVVALFSSFDARRKLERKVVQSLSELGTDAVASTSMMETTTPATRQTFLAMVETISADAVLVTHLVSVDSKSAMKDMNPQASVKVKPTYYFNVWEVELTEYVEPQSFEIKSELVLATQLYSVLSREPVWAIESKAKVVQEGDRGRNYTYFLAEADAIVEHMSADGLIAQ
jgi:hypothetical protein